MASLNDQKVLAFMFDPFLLDTMNSEEEKTSNDVNGSGKLLRYIQLVDSFISQIFGRINIRASTG